MKSLKITVLAIFALALLTGVNSMNDVDTTPDNKEIKQIDIASTSTERGKLKVPGNG